MKNLYILYHMHLQNSIVHDLEMMWYTYQKIVSAMFAGDSEVEVKDLNNNDNANYRLIIVVSNKEKAQAIKAIMPNKVPFGNLSVVNLVYGPNEEDVTPMDKSEAEIYGAAFSGNSIFDRIDSLDFTMGTFSRVKYYCIFKKQIIQFWNDDLSDFYGNYNGLPTDIADQLFVRKEILFSISNE